MVPWKKNMTIPSLWKNDHRWSLIFEITVMASLFLYQCKTGKQLKQVLPWKLPDCHYQRISTISGKDLRSREGEKNVIKSCWQKLQLIGTHGIRFLAVWEPWGMFKCSGLCKGEGRANISGFGFQPGRRALWEWVCHWLPPGLKQKIKKYKKKKNTKMFLLLWASF